MGMPRIESALSVTLDGTRVVLRGSLTARLVQTAHLAGFLSRCLCLSHLQHLRFDLLDAGIELHFATSEDARSAARRGMVQSGSGRRECFTKALLDQLAHRVWEAPVTLYRSGALLSTWRLKYLGGGRLRLRHPLLRERPTAALVATRMLQLGASVVPGTWHRDGVIDLHCDAATPTLVLDLVAGAEALEAALPPARPVALTSPVGNSRLLNVNLLLAAGALVAPALALPSTLALAGASVPVFGQACKHLRQQRVDRNTALALPAILALISGDRLPAAIMLWMFRRWDLLTRRSLRRAEIALFERLSRTAAPDPRTVRCAADAASGVFASVPGDRAAQAFADSSAPLMLCVGAAALASGGPSLAQAALRPDFFSPLLVHRRMAAADVAVRLARMGCVVRNFRTLRALRDADQVVLDDSVAWDADAEFGAAVSELRMREVVYFHAPSNEPPAALIAALGRPRLIVRSMAQTPAAYLAHQRFLGHRMVYARAVGSADRLAPADVPIAVGENCLVEDRETPVGLLRPSLGRLLRVMRIVRAADTEERSVKLATNALNTAMVLGAVYAGLPTLGIVVVGSVATGGLWVGMRRRIDATAGMELTGG
jgi:hypothetical protein